MHEQLRAREARVGFPVVAEVEVEVCCCQAGAEHAGYGAPSVPLFSADGGRGGEAEGEEVEEVGEEEGGEGVVEVGEGVVGVAEGTVG